MRNQNPLVGKILIGMKIAENKEALLFQLEGGEDILVRCDADCCSYTWVESVELPARGFPAVVSAVESIELNEDADTKDGELQFYGCKITTDAGHIIIDYRNESNGYYGGNLSWPGDYHCGGVYDQNTSKEVWKDISP